MCRHSEWLVDNAKMRHRLSCDRQHKDKRVCVQTDTQTRHIRHRLSYNVYLKRVCVYFTHSLMIDDPNITESVYRLPSKG